VSESLLRLDDVAAELSVSLRTVRRLVTRGDLPVVRVGSAVRVRPSDLRRYVLAATERRSDATAIASVAPGVVVTKGERLWD
jgi:excisionase family DNA binding protein